MSILFYVLLSVVAISFLSLVGILTLSINVKNLNKFLRYMVSFAAGALIGDVFIHLLPEVMGSKYTINISLYILLGLVSMFIVEKFIHWHHCHHRLNKNQIEPYAILNLFGDAIHNLIDGLVIAASYLVSIPVGFATTLAVILHEIPQEFGDFAVLLQGGFSRERALFFNFLTALAAVLGAIIALVSMKLVEGLVPFLIALAAGNFIYIAVADLIPELHKETDWRKSTIQLVFFLAGIGIMYLLVLME